MLQKINFPTKYNVENFIYNGFSVSSKPGFASYTISEFIEWTNDPGIGKFNCSDNVKRLIPSCQLSKELNKELPKPPKLDPFNGIGVLFGSPSKS